MNIYTYSIKIYFNGEGVWHFETKGEAVMLRPVEFIRRLQTGKDIWESIRGEEEAEETYDGI